MPQRRQLSAIMFTDLLGYTAMMGSDEDKAMHLLHQNRELQASLIEKHGGTFLKEMGDGIMSSFHSALDAVECAIEIQQAVADIPDLVLRTGIHIGDVTFKDDDVFGDGVNIASRLESLAPPGEIYVSEAVFRNIENKSSIKTQYVKEVELKNVRHPVKVYLIGNVTTSKVSSKPTPDTPPSEPIRKKQKLRLKWIYLIVILLIAAVGYPIFNYLSSQSGIRMAKTEILPKIVEASEASKYWKAYSLIQEAKEYLPEDRELQALLSNVTKSVTIHSEPLGANVYARNFADTSSSWTFFGKTPLDTVSFPQGPIRIKIALEGKNTVEDIIFGNSYTVTLSDYVEAPPGMVYIHGDSPPISIVGYDHLPSKKVGSFWADQFEVTNGEFKTFIDEGGYKNKIFWKHPFHVGDNEISWEEAMLLFKDKTGRAGPADWEAGSFPQGQADFPVGGLSWYEAAAFAEYAGKQLPTFYHWNSMANTYTSGIVVPISNMRNNAPWPVGQSKAMNIGGTFDLAGNVREWVYNKDLISGSRFILGGAWNDLPYAFTDAYMLDPMLRLSGNGFRCILPLSDAALDSLSADFNNPIRDFKAEQPIPEDIYQILVRQFSYDRSDLAATIESTDDSHPDWIKQKVSIKTAYSEERLPFFLFLPKNGIAPFQTAIFFPGDGGFGGGTSDNIRIPDYVVQNGRAVIHPIFKGTYERKDDMKSSMPNMSVQYKEHVIMWTKDVSRIIDYVETREDLESEKLAYIGYSWGGRLGPLVIATEKRFKVAILAVAGFRSQRCLPEADPFNFAPRVTIPVLMLNGQYDFYFPVESSQRPLYNTLGTPQKDKVWKTYEGSHNVPRVELIKESLAWLDKYLGAVEE